MGEAKTHTKSYTRKQFLDEFDEDFHGPTLGSRIEPWSARVSKPSRKGSSKMYAYIFQDSLKLTRPRTAGYRPTSISGAKIADLASN